MPLPPAGRSMARVRSLIVMLVVSTSLMIAIAPYPAGASGIIATPEPPVEPQGLETPEPGTEPPTPTAPPDPIGSITVYSKACDMSHAGTPFGSPVPGGSGCSALPGTMISVAANGNPFVAGQTYMDGTSALVYFAQVPAGPVTIYQAPPGGYQLARAWCGLHDKGGTQFHEVAVINGTHFQETLPPNQTVAAPGDDWLICTWVNYSNPSHILDSYFAEMHPWICPLDPVTDIDLLLESCKAAGLPVDFTVTDAAGKVQRARTSGQRDPVRFNDLASGPLAVTATVQDDQRQARVACVAVDARGAPAGDLVEVPVRIADRSVTWSVDPGSWEKSPDGIACHLFLFAT